MKVTVDTNVLVRAAIRDDEHHARVAAKLLKDAEVVAIALSTLCEFVWVLKRIYKLPSASIDAAINALISAENVVVEHPTVEAGLANLRAGGDFADGVIAYEGNRLGGDTFTSFDRKTIALLARQGRRAQLLS